MNIGTAGLAFIRLPTSTTARPAKPRGNAPRPLEAARLRHPTRFATTRDPKILELPAAAWINQPKDQEPAA